MPWFFPVEGVGSSLHCFLYSWRVNRGLKITTREKKSSVTSFISVCISFLHRVGHSSRLPRLPFLGNWFHYLDVIMQHYRIGICSKNTTDHLKGYSHYQIYYFELRAFFNHSAELASIVSLKRNQEQICFCGNCGSC